jgi:hypothetical protein
MPCAKPWKTSPRRIAMHYDSQTERNSKSLALATLFALFPDRQADVETIEALMRAHLGLADDIPAPMFVEACTRVAKTWRYPRAPNPGDIRAAAQVVGRELRAWLRAERERAHLEHMHQTAMTPLEAHSELDRLASEEPPTTGVELIAREMYITALHRCVERGKGWLSLPSMLRSEDEAV